MLSENVITAIIAAASAVTGGVIVGFFTLWTAKIAADGEDRRRKEDLARQTAEARIAELYGPLTKMLSPSPPYDDLDISDEMLGSISSRIENNEQYASPQLLEAFWRFRFACHNDRPKVHRLGEELANAAYVEFTTLKNSLGYGSILKKKSLFAKTRHKVEESFRSYRRRRWRKKRK